MRIRKSDCYFVFLVTSFVLFILTMVHTTWEHPQAAAGIEEKKRLVRDLKLTDLCLFTEARYTRHPSMADLHTAFQDHPVALEHFPSGTLLQPPTHLRRYGMD